MKLSHTLHLLFLVCVLSCGSGLRSDGEAGSGESGYSWRMDGPAFSVGVPAGGEPGLRTEWNLGTGIVVLGPEEEGEPLARLELVLGPTPQEDEVTIAQATLSLTDVRVGTSAELNAKLYVLAGSQAPLCGLRSISDSQISVKCSIIGFKMERVLVGPNDAPETITLYDLEFVARDGCTTTSQC